MNQHFYFAYGVNTNIESMQARCPGAIALGPAQLNNYSLSFRHHCDVQPEYGDYVPGMLWKIDDWSLKNLDAFEGYPVYYTRLLNLVNYKDKLVRAWCYTMVDHRTPVEPPSEYYLDLVTKGYQHNNINQEKLQRALDQSYKYFNV
jgi:gamma-glutamylcyclotransferase (GGCT)/AIG2-like uncharacterized protein YtfP